MRAGASISTSNRRERRLGFTRFSTRSGSFFDPVWASLNGRRPLILLEI
jgi:hypothetical protein